LAENRLVSFCFFSLFILSLGQLDINAIREQVIRTTPTIVCVSANPALDRRLRLPSLSLGEVNRAKTSLTLSGGKAAHVAMTAKALGARAVWIGFLGGATGDECEAGLKKYKIEVEAVRTESATRVNLEAVEDSGRVTEVLEPGGAVDRGERDAMLRVLDARLRCDWSGAGVVISGSLPPGVTPEFYRTMTEVARAAGSKVFIDTSGDALRDSLSARPEVAKPNRSEAEVLLGAKIGNVEQAIAGAKKMLGLGAGSVAITLGAEGLVWLPNAADLSWIAKPPKLKPISTVGCGDATMAGIAYSALSDMDAEDAVRLAAACGAAMCVTELGAQISEKDVQSMLSRIEVRSVVP